jgi:hypothetical protein
MGEFYKKLLTTSKIANIMGSVFTNPDAKTSYIRLIQLYNGSGSMASITLHEVPNNASAIGVADDENIFFNSVLQPSETMLIEYATPGMMLEAENDSIQAVSNHQFCTISISGGQE